MRRLKYYLMGIPLMVLLFSFSAQAATSTFQSSITDADGETKTFKGVSYSQIPYDEYEDYENSSGGHNPVYKWHVNQNFRVEGFTTQKYYTGLMTWTINVTTSLSTDRNMPVLTSTNVDQGLNVYIRYTENTYYQIIMIFDNYYARNTNVGFPTITQDFFISMSSQNPSLMNITYSVIDRYTNLRGTDSALDNGLAGLITDSIDNSTALATIAGWLYDIKSQDFTYYNQLVTQIAALTQSQNTANSNLLLILNELDLDFQQVQTILDLFPSYRTQVLQYWQQLLEMNTAQSSAAAEIESQYADRESQSSQLINGMGSVVMPSISSNDLDILGSVDTTQKTNFFGLISLITHNELVTKIMLIIVLGAIVGYILYGKK